MHKKRVFILKALFFEILKPKHLCNIFFKNLLHYSTSCDIIRISRKEATHGNQIIAA